MYDQDLAEVSVEPVNDIPSGTIYGTFGFTALGTGFAFAYQRGGAVQRIEYVEYDADGSLRCGPSTLVDSGSPTFQSMDAFDTTDRWCRHQRQWDRIVTQIFDNGGANPRMPFRSLGPNLYDAPR